MPELSRFYGIIIKMIFKGQEQHNKPHVHVYYNEYMASLGLDGELLAGKLPVKQLRMVQAWLAIHEDELYSGGTTPCAVYRLTKSARYSKEVCEMYIIDGIAYAGEQSPALQVCGVRPLDGHMLWVRFNTGETRIFDFTPLLNAPAFAPLADDKVFKGVYIDYGIPVWNDGDIDIAPETLYNEGAVAEVVQ